MFIVKTTIDRSQMAQRDAQTASKNFDDLNAWYQKHRQNHKIVGLYTVIPSGMSGYSIWNVSTAAELDQLLADHPLTGAINVEITNVTDQFDQQISHAKDVAARFFK